jgi:ABC-2 type transport system ATP-binding protein
LSAEPTGLRVEGLSCRRSGRWILDRVSFELRPGEIVAVIGPNGAGKTTLLEAVVGIQRPAAGRVSFGGRALRRLGERARVFSFMPDDAEPPAEVSVAALLDHAVRYGRPPPGLAEALRKGLDLQPLLRARGGELSRGERRRVALFAALCTSRPVVVLDEPLGTFDPLQLLAIPEVLRDRARAGASLLLSVHQMSDAEKIADRLLLLRAGRVVAAGTLDELRWAAGRSGGTLEQVFLALLQAEQARSEHARP